MNIYLCDREWNRDTGSSWSRALGAVFGLGGLKNARQWNQPKADHAGYRDAKAVIFVHSTRESEWVKQSKEVSTLCHFILVRSGGNQATPENCSDNVHACSWSPLDFERVPQSPRLARLIRQLKGEDMAAIDWLLLKPDPAEELFAARLVVDAHKTGNAAISPDLAQMAADLLEIDATDTRVLQESVEKFSAALNAAMDTP